MSRARARATWFVLWAGLVFLSLRPLEPLARAVDLALTPLQLLSGLASPLRLVFGRRVAAAERALANAAESEAEESERMLSALARNALPLDPALAAGRRALHAEVIGRPQNKDRLLVALPDARGVAMGCPVACGDVYVGRVVALEEEADGAGASAVVELVTGSTFRVGARLERAEDVLVGPRESASERSEVSLIVGGLVASPRSKSGERVVRLAVHRPSQTPAAGGIARVHERFDEIDPYGPLAEGLLLGEVHVEGPKRTAWIEPELDYLDGLFQVAILCPEDRSLPLAQPFERALTDSNWLKTGTWSPGDPAPWRATIKIPRGSAHGVHEGAAVTGIGARLLGRVTHERLFDSDVSALADPGFSLAAVAQIEGEDEPRVLGRLVSEGRTLASASTRASSILFRWIVRIGLEDCVVPGEAGRVRALLFSGSGDPGLPAGLLIGEAALPLDAKSGEERTIELEASVEPRDVSALFVRRLPPGATRGSVR